jgi:hypothetical protein
MCLEALGKSMDDFKGDTSLLFTLAEHFATALTDAADKGAGLGGLRLPDFLQLLAVAECLDPKAVALAPQDPEFGKAVGKARGEAVKAILRPKFFLQLVENFSVGVEQESVFDGRMTQLIDEIGRVNRGLLPKALKKNKALKGAAKPEDQVKADSVAWLNTELAKNVEKADAALKALEAEAPPAGKAAQKKLARKIAEAKGALARLQNLQRSNVYDAAIDPQALDALQPLDVYASKVKESLSAHLDQGHQIVGHVHNHFIRVEGVTDKGVSIDDPGNQETHDDVVEWRKLREIGGFTRYTVLK